MSPQTSRQRESRIDDRKYFQRPDWLTHIKHRLAQALLILAVPLLVWLVAVLAFGWGGSIMSPGPVADVHAPWDNRCDACHVPFHGIDTQDRCKTCHGGPVHFAGQSDDANRCATCHADHRGRGASLVHVPDSDCTGCHQALGAVRPGGQLVFQEHITSFVRDHPVESRSVRDFKPNGDRTLKFSHVLHMSPGMVRDSNYPRPFRLGDIKDQADQQRYRALQAAGEKENPPVQLDCSACHRLDASDFGFKNGGVVGLPPAAVLPHRAASGNPLPITYENQCKACHPLTSFDDREPSLKAPHRVQPAELRKLFEGTYAGRMLNNSLAFQSLATRLDRRLDRPSSLDVQEAKKVVERTVTSAFDRLLSQVPNACAKCHLLKPPVSAAMQPTVQPLRSRDVWYKYAWFTHISHRAVSCKECHAGAYGNTGNETLALAELEAAQVPEVDKCMDCHGPFREAERGPAGGARADCVECHRYHNGAAPLQGMGAAARDPKRKLNLGAFLRGEPPTDLPWPP